MISTELKLQRLTAIGIDEIEIELKKLIDLISKLKYSEAANLLTSIGEFIDLHYLFELEDLLQESI